MTDPVRITFEGSSVDGGAPFVTVHNPRVLPAALFSQVLRFGLRSATDRNSLLSGRLKGGQDALMNMIQSYGVAVEVVPLTDGTFVPN